MILPNLGQALDDLLQSIRDLFVTPREIEQAIENLKTGNYTVKHLAKAALIKIDAPAIPALRSAIEQGRLWDSWRVLALETLGELGDSRAVDLLIDILNSDYIHARVEAVQALEKVGDGRAVLPLIANFRFEHTDEDTLMELHTYTTVALGKLGDTEFEPLMAVLADDNIVVRACAAESLGRLGDPRAVEGLIHLLSDPNRQVRLPVIRALGEIGDLRAVKPLLEHLSESEWIARDHTLRALGKLGDQAVIQHLAYALDDPEPRVQCAAIYALADVGSPQVLDLLLPSVFNPDPEVRCAVGLALGTLGDPEALPTLEHMLRFDDGKTRAGNKVRDYAETGIKRLRESQTNAS